MTTEAKQGGEFDLSKEPVTRDTIRALIGEGKRMFEMKAELLDIDQGAKFEDTLRIGYAGDGKRITFHRDSSLFFFERKEGTDEFITPGEDRCDMMLAVEDLGKASDFEGERIKLGYLYSVDSEFLQLTPFLLIHPLTQTNYLMRLRPLIEQKAKKFLLEGLPREERDFVFGQHVDRAMGRFMEITLPPPPPFQTIKPSEQHARKFLESLRGIKEVKSF